jgi:hypothetical protein
MQQDSKKRSAGKTIFRLLALFLVPAFIIGTVTAVAGRNYYDIYDWYKLRDYTPTTQIEKLATDSYMTDSAKNIFYVHDPQLNEKTKFNIHCEFKERTFVLGCYTGSNIYLLDVKEERLAGVETVTAAHEMLHAAYSRLSLSEREKVDQLLRDAFAKQDDKRLKDLIEDYRKHDSASVPTELHSILATEVKDLGPELEKYYGQYFTDRSKVVAEYNRYEEVFASLQVEIEDLQAKIDKSGLEIKQLEANIMATRDKINSVNANLSKLDSSGDIAGYNALVPEQNSLVNKHNADFRAYEALINTHNADVKKINAAVLQNNSLINSIDSKFEEI